jgi:hypothetical protein
VPGFRVFAPKSRQTVSAERGVVGGEKRFEFVLVAQEPGNFTIDGIGFTYFDTKSERYATARAAPIAVTVVPGDIAAAAPGARASGIDLASTDIRHIRRADGIGDDLELAGGANAILLWAMPVVIGLAGAIVKVHRRRQAACVKVSARRAFKDLMTQVSMAAAVTGKEGGTENAAAILSRGIARYIAVRSGCRESSVDIDYIESIGVVSEETRRRLSGLLATLDQVRFAPAGFGESNMERLLYEARSVLEQVNREWKV